MYANGVSEVFISFGNYISSILSHCCTLNLMAGPIPITLLLPELCSEIVHGQPLNVYKKNNKINNFCSPNRINEKNQNKFLSFISNLKTVGKRLLLDIDQMRLF